MKEFRPHSQNWNEFQWEREIRRDERRISCYYRELPECLDLPGEEEMIFNSLLSRPDLVPSGGTPDSLRSWRPDVEEEEDDEPAFDDNSRRPGSELVIQLDHLAVEWNTLAVSRLRAGLELPGLGICCAFGKLLARTADFIDTIDPAERALRISLGKRALADLNDLVGALRQLGEQQRSMAAPLELFIELLSHAREQLLDLLDNARQGKY